MRQTAAGRRMDRRETRDLSLTARDDGFLASLNPGEKLGNIGLRVVGGDGGHRRSEVTPQISCEPRPALTDLANKARNMVASPYVARPDSLEPVRRSQP